jgi:2-oxoisovalerate dehydrogenase E2 component (dihydrolipoyl transacylase)
MIATNRKPWVVGTGKDEKIEIRPIMVVALTYDHRIIDGSTVCYLLCCCHDMRTDG